MSKKLSLFLAFFLIAWTSRWGVGQEMNSLQLHENIEAEHGIRMVYIAGGQLPTIDLRLEEARETFGIPRRRLTKILNEEATFRDEGAVVESFYLGATEISGKQIESIYRSLKGPKEHDDPLDISPFAPSRSGNLNEPGQSFRFSDAVMLCNALSRQYDLPEYYRLILTLEQNEEFVNHSVGLWTGIPFLVEIPDVNGKGFRLPTAWEWEYACRGGANTWFSYGDNPNDMCEHGCIHGCKDERGRLYKRPPACASFKPNALGLYDMHGSVWEWCMGHPVGNRLPDVQYLKGGSIDSIPFESRCTYLRRESTANSGDGYLGFGLRLARSE